MEYFDNHSQVQPEETIQKKRKKRSAKDDDDELPHSKKLGSEDGFVFSTRRVTRSASKQQHQQHGEGKKQKKPVCGLRWREMTDKELDAHKKKAEESEGFDVGEVPDDVLMNIIMPCALDRPASALRPYNKMAKKALVVYNNEKGTKYKFVKHVRVNRKGGPIACWYYITFQAKDKKAGSQNFQTVVCSRGDLIDVRFCRVEKKLEEPQEMVSPRKGLTIGNKPKSSNPNRLAVVAPGLGPISRKGPRVVWDSQLTRIFLELLLKEIEQEGRGTTQMSNHSLGRIGKQLSALTNLEITSLQCKNRYAALRRDWQAWQLLTNAKRGATGLGFNPQSGTFTAPDFFWSNLIAQNESVAKFRECPLDHEELMQRVFQEVTATGKYVYILGQDDSDQPVGLEMDPENLILNEDEGHVGDEGRGDTVGEDIGIEVGSSRAHPHLDVGATPSNSRSMPKFPGRDSSGNKRKTPSSGTDELSQSMDRILRNMDKQQPFKLVVRVKHTIADAKRIMDRMEYFAPRPRPAMYWWLLDHLMGNPLAVDVFVEMDSEEDRMEYIHHVHQRATRVADGQHDPYAPPPAFSPPLAFSPHN